MTSMQTLVVSRIGQWPCRGIGVVAGWWLAMGLTGCAGAPSSVKETEAADVAKQTSPPLVFAPEVPEDLSIAVGDVRAWADVLQIAPDPEVVTDAATRERIVASGWPWRVKEKRSGIVLLLVPAGEFTMGSPTTEEQRETDEAPHRRVIRKPFYLGETEVSQAEWKRVMATNPSSHQGDEFPVENVNWHEARGFLQRVGLRLPSEAEWEYACRAGTSTPFATGPSITWNQANFRASHRYGGSAVGTYREETIEVGQLWRNAWGFADMHGNVWEWCEDVYADYPAAGDERPMVRDGAERVLRGGFWGAAPGGCRSAERVSLYSRRDYDLGFRAARTPR